MSSRARTAVFAAVTIVCLGVLAWVLFTPGQGGIPAGRSEPTQSVLCANPRCGFTGQLVSSQLVPPQDARDIAREPANGPGYVCPKCKQSSLYPDLVKCPACGAVYLPVPGSAGSQGGKCPQCGRSS